MSSDSNIGLATVGPNFGPYACSGIGDVRLFCHFLVIVIDSQCYGQSK